MSTTSTKTSSTKAATTASVTPFAITTTFDPPAACATQFAMLENMAYEVWFNPIVPVSETTITSCYASQYVSSYLSQLGGITQAAFSPLICPSAWSMVGPYTSNYIACCPTGFEGIAPASSYPSDRPAYMGTCYSPLEAGSSILVTAYDDTGVTATSVWVPTVSAQVFAHPYEGFAYGAVVVPSLTSGSASTTDDGSSASSTTGSASTSSSVTTSAAAASSTAAAASSSSQGLSGGAIAGIAIGSILGAGLILGLMAFYFARRRRQEKRLSGGDAEGRTGGSQGPLSSYSQSIPPVYGGHDDKDPTQSTEKYGGELEALSPASEMATDKPASELPAFGNPQHARSGIDETMVHEMDGSETTPSPSVQNGSGIPDVSPTVGRTSQHY